MNRPEFWIIGGPNGAGKTTCAKAEPINSLLPKLKFANPDDRTLEKILAAGYRGFGDTPEEFQKNAFIDAANETYAEISAAIDVLSSKKYMKVVEDVKSRNGFVGLVYIAVSSPLISVNRVEKRVSAGGHGVPRDKIVERWNRSLDLLPWFAKNVTAFWIYDNSGAESASIIFRIAHGKNGVLDYQSESTFPEMKATLAKITMKD